jgi:hypothetical protein
MPHSLPSISAALGLALWAGSARATTSVVVTGFQPEDNESFGLAVMLSDELERQLGFQGELSILALDDIPPLHGADPRLYLESCPRGEFTGCSFVIAQHAGAAYAVTGSLRVGEEEVAIQLGLVDVAQSREAVSLDLAVPPGGDQALMDQVAGLLGRLIRGELGQLEDIRREGAYDEEETRELVLSELDELVAETGAEVQLSSLSTGLEVLMPGFGPGDLEAMRGEEGLTEWERLGMTERSYLAFRNSGVDLQSWRALSTGRMLQLLVRPRTGLLFGPVNGAYYGAFQQDLSLPVEDRLVETYAWQALDGGLGFGYGLDLGLGLTPSVELELGAARVHGRYRTVVIQENAGDSLRPSDELDSGTVSTLLSAGLRLAPFPTRSLRPVLGAGVVLWRGQAVTDLVDLSSLTVDLPTWGALDLAGARGLGGLELRLGERWDLVAQVPLMILLGEFSRVHDEELGALASREEPPAPMPVSAGLELGVQLRIGGRDPSRRGPRHGQLEDEGALELLD